MLQQYRVQSLNDQLDNGRPWDLDRTHGGLRLLPPQLGAEESGFHEGNADAIWRNRELIAQYDPEWYWSAAPTTCTGSTTRGCSPSTGSGGRR